MGEIINPIGQGIIGVSQLKDNSIIASKMAIPSANIIHINCNRTDEYVGNGSSDKPYRSFAEFRTALGRVQSPEDCKTRLTIMVAGGVYDEHIELNPCWSYLFIAMGTVVIGSGDLNDFGSTTPRNIYYDVSIDDQPAGAPTPSVLFTAVSDIKSLTGTATSYMDGWKISGDILITLNGSSPGYTELHAEGMDIAGSIDGTSGAGAIGISLNGCKVDGGIQQGTMEFRLSILDGCNVLNGIETTSYGRWLNSFIDGDLKIHSGISTDVKVAGMYKCEFGDNFTYIKDTGINELNPVVDSQTYLNMLAAGVTFPDPAVNIIDPMQAKFVIYDSSEHADVSVTNMQEAIDAILNMRDAANGIATLGADSKLKDENIPDYIKEGMTFQGPWDPTGLDPASIQYAGTYVQGSGTEYYTNTYGGTKPVTVMTDDAGTLKRLTEMPETSIGGLAEGEWAWDSGSGRVYINIGGNPAGLDVYFSTPGKGNYWTISAPATLDIIGDMSSPVEVKQNDWIVYLNDTKGFVVNDNTDPELVSSSISIDIPIGGWTTLNQALTAIRGELDSLNTRLSTAEGLIAGFDTDKQSINTDYLLKTYSSPTIPNLGSAGSIAIWYNTNTDQTCLVYKTLSGQLTAVELTT